MFGFKTAVLGGLPEGYSVSKKVEDVKRIAPGLYSTSLMLGRAPPFFECTYYCIIDKIVCKNSFLSLIVLFLLECVISFIQHDCITLRNHSRADRISE